MDTIKNLIIFGAIRGLIKYQFIKDREKVLVTDRIGIAIASGVTFPVVFPYALYKDARRIEVVLRGLNSDQYKTKIEKPKDVIF
jgi:hypothetical protein